MGESMTVKRHLIEMLSWPLRVDESFIPPFAIDHECKSDSLIINPSDSLPY